ncbi:ABC transporter substrate-binding protein [Jannaschia seohaensis]|uniref:Peptide/nickel transport system substrate-binding protein n=1 Tax=Jannaschia seohaensis TaxID=475081 RepID=A0A2Y9B4V3_9RHOB|nr:ABC transporter substrate-binding protein [Jannaschia seohaensis]PWJ11461.1 peptide/nickel transport system substrate-binding protein [Jannaschia seohaensis]SSA51441.1 peptide/nickel transport system substrate-binding protein [Jannaschia seohaensis]
MRPILTAALVAAALPAGAAELRFASTTDPNTLDPNAGNSAPVFSLLGNVYEGLVRRGRDMSIEPALATSWEPIGDGEGWRFNLREGVTFHGGQSFDADDVIFSYERASSEQSDTSSWFAPVSEVIKVDDYTVDIMTSAPNPIFPDSIANWMMMDAGWAAENGAERPNIEQGNYATTNTNGTGPYMITERQPGLRTVLEAYDGWWGEDRGNVERAIFQPVQNSATAVAALLSGELDLIEPVPVQDANRVESAEGVDVLRGIEARVIMLGFPHDAEGLIAGGEGNPFTDPRVRQAVAQAINVPAILQTVMRGSAEPVAQLMGAGMRGYTQGLERPAYDQEAARALLAEAGYPDGFRFSLKCPNDRYLNDEAVCTAINAMLAQVGLEPVLETMPVANYWPTLRADDHDMYLLGWSPGTFDAEHPIRFLLATPDEEARLGSWNFGGYSNPRIDELLPMIQSEIDDTARQAMLDEVAQIQLDDVAYVPLYVQPLIWGVKEGIEVVQRPDNFLVLRWIEMG